MAWYDSNLFTFFDFHSKFLNQSNWNSLNHLTKNQVYQLQFHSHSNSSKTLQTFNHYAIDYQVSLSFDKPNFNLSLTICHRNWIFNIDTRHPNRPIRYQTKIDFNFRFRLWTQTSNSKIDFNFRCETQLEYLFSSQHWIPLTIYY